MSDDLLEQATRALRERGEASSEDLRRLRAGVLEGVRVSERRRSRLWALLLPIAAVLVATSAVAAGTGGLGAAFRRARQLFVTERVVATGPTSPAAGGPGPGASAVPSSSTAPEVEPAPPVAPVPVAPVAAPSEPPAVASAPAPAAIAKPSSVASTMQSVPSTPPAVEDAGAAELALYKRAHQLHFVDKDPAAALPAWEAYLASSPSGPLVVEARYNRAICLVKLGRKAEAKAALQPFADGAVASGYRQDEARKLITALEAP